MVGSFAALEPMWVHEHQRPAKRYFDVHDQAPNPADGPLALDALYFLAPRHSVGATPSVRTVESPEALARLMAGRHMADVLDRQAHERDFGVLGRIAEQVPARELLRPAGLGATDATVDVILSDVRKIG
jgi:hypothetical protein